MDEKTADGWPLSGSRSGSGSSIRSLQDWEKQCIDELDRECGVSDNYFEDPEVAQSLWQGFETTAHAIAQLYKASDWYTFQRTASKTTQLYKDGVDAHRRGFECGLAVGRRKMTRDLVGLLKRCHRKYLYREELLGFLVGKDVPLRNSSIRGSRHRLSASPHHSSATNVPSAIDSDLAMFKDALALPFQASLSDITTASSRSPLRRSSWGRAHPQGSVPGVGGGAGSSPLHHSSGTAASEQPLSDFFLEELNRHRKRPASVAALDDSEMMSGHQDVTMDSPTHSYSSYGSPVHKRNRFM